MMSRTPGAGSTPNSGARPSRLPPSMRITRRPSRARARPRFTARTAAPVSDSASTTGDAVEDVGRVAVDDPGGQHPVDGRRGRRLVDEVLRRRASPARSGHRAEDGGAGQAGQLLAAPDAPAEVLDQEDEDDRREDPRGGRQEDDQRDLRGDRVRVRVGVVDDLELAVRSAHAAFPGDVDHRLGQRVGQERGPRRIAVLDPDRQEPGGVVGRDPGVRRELVR